MAAENRIRSQKDLIESIGRMHEKQGFGLTPGRILGLLMVMDKEQFTFDEIVEELQISKSSASNALRILEARNFIEYTTIPGDRKRYFRIRTHDKFAIIDEHQRTLQMTHDLFRAILDVKSNKKSRTSLFLKDALELVRIFLDRFEELRAEFLNGK